MRVRGVGPYTEGGAGPCDARALFDDGQHARESELYVLSAGIKDTLADVSIPNMPVGEYKVRVRTEGISSQEALSIDIGPFTPTATPTQVTATPTLPPTATPTLPPTATPTVPPTATPTVPATSTPTETDTSCPIVTIDSPPDRGAVNAGSTVQVKATATDNKPNDTGVKTFIYSATGDALVAPGVSQELPLPKALPIAPLSFVFSVKKAADLATVTDKTITVSVAAADNAMPPNQCDPQTITLTVLGMLDNCLGQITTDNPADFDGEPFIITVTLTGAAADMVARVTSVNPGGQFDLTSQENGVYTVTLYYEGDGYFTLTFTALDAAGNVLCSGSIELDALGPPNPSNALLQSSRRMPAGASSGAFLRP
jgi:hypothetical protein